MPSKGPKRSTEGRDEILRRGGYTPQQLKARKPKPKPKPAPRQYIPKMDRGKPRGSIKT